MELRFQTARAARDLKLVGAARELRPRRDRRQPDGCPLALSVNEYPVGKIDGVVRGVVELDELVGGVGASAEADLVNLDREDVPHPLGS